MKTRYLIITLFIFYLFFSSCESFLIEEPYTKITPGSFYLTEDGIKSGVNGLYSGLRSFYYTGFFLYMCEGQTDITKDAIAMDSEFKTWTIDATSSNVTAFWDACYVGINETNTIIDVLENQTIPKLDDNTRIRYLAESRFIRAHFYYHLVQQFGDIHLSTEPTTTIETEAYKTSTDEVWNFIIDELKFCIDNLPEKYSASEYGRITKYAAMHNLARVYLTCKRNNTGNLQDAKSLCEDIIKSGNYSLVESHEFLWDIANEKNSEIIFSVLFTQNTELNSGGNKLAVYFMCSYSEVYPSVVARTIAYGRPWSRIRPTDFFIKLYNEDIDQRWDDCFRTEWHCNMPNARNNMFSPFTKQMEVVSWELGALAIKIPKKLWTAQEILAAWPVIVFLPDSMTNKITVQSVKNPNAEYSSNTFFQQGLQYPSLVKHLDPLRTSVNSMDGSRDVCIFRLADTYLLAAEACYMLGELDRAAEYINVVRVRAAKPGKEQEMKISSNDIDLDFILNERGLELIGEGHRWYDLKRTNKLYERLTNPKINFATAPLFRDFHVLRPIPRTQLTRISNPEDFKQNPGYGD